MKFKLSEALHITKDDTSIGRNVRNSILNYYKENFDLTESDIKTVKVIADEMADTIIDGLHEIANNKESDDLQDEILALDRQIKNN